LSNHLGLLGSLWILRCPCFASAQFGLAQNDIVVAARRRSDGASPLAGTACVLQFPQFPSPESSALIELAPSILSADFARLADEVTLAVEGGATLLHVDVMDGHFVPNITTGGPMVASLRKATELPLDVHLMIENPDQYIPAFADAGADWISVHQ